MMKKEICNALNQWAVLSTITSDKNNQQQIDFFNIISNNISTSATSSPSTKFSIISFQQSIDQQLLSTKSINKKFSTFKQMFGKFLKSFDQQQHPQQQQKSHVVRIFFNKLPTSLEFDELQILDATEKGWKLEFFHLISPNSSETITSITSSSSFDTNISSFALKIRAFSNTSIQTIETDSISMQELCRSWIQLPTIPVELNSNGFGISLLQCELQSSQLSILEFKETKICKCHQSLLEFSSVINNQISLDHISFPQEIEKGVCLENSTICFPISSEEKEVEVLKFEIIRSVPMSALDIDLIVGQVSTKLKNEIFLLRCLYFVCFKSFRLYGKKEEDAMDNSSQQEFQHWCRTFVDQRPNQVLLLSTQFDFEGLRNDKKLKKMPLNQKRTYVAWITEDCILLKV